MKMIFVILMLLLMPQSLAALEYIRLEGNVTLNYDDGVQQVGLTPGQFIFMDFAIDTEIDPFPAFSDDFAQYFQIDFYAGNYLVDPTFAVSSAPANDHVYRSIPLFGTLVIEEEIYCGSGAPPPQCLNPLAFDWVVGTQATMLLDSFDLIADLEVTYRGSNPPPPIPVPAALYLLFSALMSTALVRRTTLKPV